MYDRILVPTDGSRGAERAVDHAVDLALAFDAGLSVLHVIEDRGDGADVLAPVAERARGEGVPVETVLAEGTPREEITAYAEANPVDLIVMGTHGRTGLERRLVGSVAEAVVRTAPVPVLTVGPGPTDAVADPERARELARAALEEAGHGDATVDDPSRGRGNWVVRAEAGGRTFNVHVDAATGETRVARITPGE